MCFFLSCTFSSDFLLLFCVVRNCILLFSRKQMSPHDNVLGIPCKMPENYTSFFLEATEFSPSSYLFVCVCEGVCTCACVCLYVCVCVCVARLCDVWPCYPRLIQDQGWHWTSCRHCSLQTCWICQILSQVTERKGWGLMECWGTQRKPQKG